MKRLFQIFLMIMFVALSTESVHPETDKMIWWRDAKFGMFIHWGIYAVPAEGEWVMKQEDIPISEYEEFAEEFNATEFDAEEWVGLAKQAGMKYLVITAKHHDGFCMWNTALTDYDVVDRTPFGRDVIAELGQACKNQGIVFGVYYSILDWHHPDASSSTTFASYRDNYLFPQVTELIQNYPVDVIWFDGDWLYSWKDQDGIALYNLCISLNPLIVVNDRVKRSLTDAGDYLTYEQEVPESPPERDWESCMTINASWGYTYWDNYWKTDKELIRTLLEIDSKGGNLLLNVGPTADGIIPEPAVNVLNGMGEWLSAYGESVYGTRTSPVQDPAFGQVTYKDNIYFLHVWKMRESKIIEFAFTLKWEATLKLLSDNSPVSFTKYSDVLSIDLNGVTLDPIATVLCFAPQDFVTAESDGSFILNTNKVQLVGDQICLEASGNVGCWTASDDYVFWKLKVDALARYEVQIEYAAAPSYAGKSIAVQVGDEEILFSSVSTGGWQTYEQFSIGEIILPSGWSELVVKPVGTSGAYINLLRITLVPSVRRPTMSEIKVNPDRSVQLNWAAMSGVSAYHVYRDTIPDFTPDKITATNRIGTNVADQDPSASGIQWNDPETIVRNPQRNYYYLVTAAGTVESDNSNRLGVFSYPLKTTEGTNFNHISLSLQGKTISDATVLMETIPGCNSVARWAPSFQGFEQAIPELSFTNFSVESGHSYYANVCSDSFFTLTGEYADPVYSLITTATTGFNEIMLPLDKTQITTASDLMADIPNCNSVARWNARIQEYEQFVAELPFSDFKVRVGHPYSVNVTANGTWPTTLSGKATEISRPDDNETTVVGSQSPHLVWGKIIGREGMLDQNPLHFTASIAGKQGQVLTDLTPGCGMRDGIWYAQLSALKSLWQAGDLLRVELNDPARGVKETVEIPLTYNPADQAPDLNLERSGIPIEFCLCQNHPNPANPSTTIRFDLPKPSRVRLVVYDLKGREVSRVVDGCLDQGTYEIHFDASTLSSGVYFYRIETDDFQSVRKMIVIK